MPFHFNMQKVLDYREQLEEEAKVQMAKVQAQLKLAQTKFDDLKERFAEANEKCRGKIMQNAERWLHDQYIKGLKSDLNEAALQLRMLRQLLEEARKQLAARAIDKKLLEKLKDRQKIQFIKAELKQEQIFNDEIATIRYKAPAI